MHFKNCLSKLTARGKETVFVSVCFGVQCFVATRGGEVWTGCESLQLCSRFKVLNGRHDDTNDFLCLSKSSYMRDSHYC